MPIGSDFSVAANGNIRHTSGTTKYTVLELHRWLQDLADDQQAAGDDLIDITVETPSDRSTDNIITLIDHSVTSGPVFNIDDTASQFLYDGSISQRGGNELYSGLRVLGAVNNANTQLMIIQDNNFYQYTTTPSAPFWGDQSTGGYNGDATAGILMQVMLKTRVNGVDIDRKKARVQARHWGDTYDFFNFTLGQGVSVAAIGTTPDAQNNTTQGTVTAYTEILNSGGTANAPVGGYQTINLNNGNGAQPYYSQWTYGARNLKALWEYIKDLSGRGTAKTIDSVNGELFLGVTHSIPYDGEATGPFVERETLVWGTQITYDTLVAGPFTPGNLVEIGANGAAGRVMHDNGTTVLTVALDNTAITILDDDVITEYSGPGAVATTTTAAVNVTITDNNRSGGSALLLGLNDAGTTGNLYIQLLNGVAPVDNLQIKGATSAATALTDGTPTARTVPKIYLGSYTGTLIGAYGVGVESADLTANDTIQDLLGVTQTPPNNVTFTVSGLVSSEDRVLVAPRSSTVINFAQNTLNGTLSGATVTAVVVTTAIPADTPTSGTIRIELDSGIYRYVAYTSYAASTFTIASTDFSGANIATTGNDVFISYIDKIAGASSESFTSVFSSTRDLFVRVRDGGGTPIKTFESTTAQLTSTGGSIGAIRTSDL